MQQKDVELAKKFFMSMGINLNPIKVSCDDILEWGYGGSGPSQLAWCILRECGLTKPQTERLYMRFKADVVANLPRDGFTITRQQVMNWVKQAGPGN